MIFSRKHVLIVLSLLPLLLFMTSEEESHTSNPIQFVGKVVNFLVLFGGLTFLLYKPVRKFLENRGKEIDSNIKEGRQSKQDAEKKLQMAQSQLDALAVEIKKMKDDAEREGRKASDRFFEIAGKEAERLKLLAGQEIEMLGHLSSKELREFVTNLATERARERLIKRITAEDHIYLIDKSIDKFGTLYEKSASN